MAPTTIQRRPFDYDGEELLVNGFQRSTIEDLEALLAQSDTIASTKKGTTRTRQSLGSSDESAAFYHAQCIHYGLPPFEERVDAKKALSEALAGKLKVPKIISDVEKAMKKEYASLEEAQKPEKPEKPAVATKAGTKRTAPDAGKENKTKEPAKKKAKVAKITPLDKGDLEELHGRYTVTVPDIESGYGSDRDGPYKIWIMQSSNSTDYSTYTGWFDFGPFEGYMKSTSVDRKNRIITFQWRGHEKEGASTFGSSNIITLTFGESVYELTGDAEGSVFKKCKLSGKKDMMPTPVAKDSKKAQLWEYKYSQLTQENYDRENRSRWGGSGW